MGKPPASRLIDKLPAALEVSVDVIKRAVEESRQYLRESEEAAWRAAFRPHAVILTERQRPQPLFVAAFIAPTPQTMSDHISDARMRLDLETFLDDGAALSVLVDDEVVLVDSVDIDAIMLALESAEESVLVVDVLGRRLTYGLMALPKSFFITSRDYSEAYALH